MLICREKKEKLEIIAKIQFQITNPMLQIHGNSNQEKLYIAIQPSHVLTTWVTTPITLSQLAEPRTVSSIISV